MPRLPSRLYPDYSIDCAQTTLLTYPDYRADCADYLVGCAQTAY